MCDREINLIFVREVEKHKVLYNNTLPEYSKKHITEAAWGEIATKVNMTSTECKEKWRNLRTVFLRGIKTLPGESGIQRKRYYLEKAMRFCLPFVRGLVPLPSENLPEVPQHEKTDEILEIALSDDCISLENSSDTVQFSQALPTQPHSNPSASSERTVLPQHSTHPPVQSSFTSAKKSLKLRNKSEAYADQCVAEYFKAKKARLEVSANEAATISHNIKRNEGLRMFLLGLLPELEELSDSQIKLFRRRILSLIDEISTSSLLQCTSFFSLASPQQDPLQTSDPLNTFDIHPHSNSIQVKASPSP